MHFTPAIAAAPGPAQVPSPGLAAAIVRALVLGALLALAAPLRAQSSDVPYWASIRAETLNMRKGPSRDYPVDWVYRRPGLPLKVVRVMQGWRLVQDPEGAQGWVFASLLTRERGAIVIGGELAPMRETPDPQSSLRWQVEPGVVGRLGDCEANWCRFDVAGRAGWIEQRRLWGAGDP